MPVWTTVIHIQPFRQTAALDGRAQHVLAGARVLVGDPAAVDEQPRVIVDQNEQVRALAAAGAGMWNELFRPADYAEWVVGGYDRPLVEAFG